MDSPLPISPPFRQAHEGLSNSSKSLHRGPSGRRGAGTEVHVGGAGGCGQEGPGGCFEDGEALG